MGCGCRKANTAAVFVYTAPNGSVREYRTEVEAKAAVIRGGGAYAAK